MQKNVRSVKKVKYFMVINVLIQKFKIVKNFLVLEIVKSVVKVLVLKKVVIIKFVSKKNPFLTVWIKVMNILFYVFNVKQNTTWKRIFVLKYQLINSSKVVSTTTPKNSVMNVILIEPKIYHKLSVPKFT